MVKDYVYNILTYHTIGLIKDWHRFDLRNYITQIVPQYRLVFPEEPVRHSQQLLFWERM